MLDDEGVSATESAAVADGDRNKDIGFTLLEWPELTRLDQGGVCAMLVALGAGLRATRLDRGLSLVEIGRRVGQSGSVLSRMELARRVPDLTTLWRVCAAVGVAPSRLMLRAEQEAFPLGNTPWEAVAGTCARPVAAAARSIRGGR
jgi:hypothetical protein